MKGLYIFTFSVNLYSPFGIWNDVPGNVSGIFTYVHAIHLLEYVHLAYKTNTPYGDVTDIPLMKISSSSSRLFSSVSVLWINISTMSTCW